MSDGYPNGILVRVQGLERRLDRIEDLEPAVMKQEIRDVKDDLRSIRSDVTWVKRTLIGFLVTFTSASITMTLLLTRGIG